MAIWVVTVLVDLVIESIMVGCTFFLLAPKSWRTSLPISYLLIAIWLFFLDVYYLPALNTLDITFTVGNESVSNILELQSNMRLFDFLKTGFVDCFFVVPQTFLAVFIGKRARRRLELSKEIIS